MQYVMQYKINVITVIVKYALLCFCYIIRVSLYVIKSCVFFSNILFSEFSYDSYQSTCSKFLSFFGPSNCHRRFVATAFHVSYTVLSFIDSRNHIYSTQSIISNSCFLPPYYRTTSW